MDVLFAAGADSEGARIDAAKRGSHFRQQFGVAIESTDCPVAFLRVLNSVELIGPYLNGKRSTAAIAVSQFGLLVFKAFRSVFSSVVFMINLQLTLPKVLLCALRLRVDDEKLDSVFDAPAPQIEQCGRFGVAGGAPSVRLVDYRERVRCQLHNYFATHGHNLLEAAGASEAAALFGAREGGLDLLIAEVPQTTAICEGLRQAHPALEVPRIMDGPEFFPE